MQKYDDLKIKQELQNDREFDARVSRCSGLIGRIAVRQSDGTRVHAANAKKSDGPFYCPLCLSEAIIRKCVEKIDHFE